MAPPYAYQQPQLSYRDILMMRQHEMRQARHARQVAGTAQPCLGGQRATRLDGVEQMWRGWWGGGGERAQGLLGVGRMRLRQSDK